MAFRSPSRLQGLYHSYWGGVITPASLPNVAGSPTQSPNLQSGDIGYVQTPGSVGMWSCRVATLGAAEWTKIEAGSARLQNLVPYNLNQAGTTLFASFDPTPPIPVVEKSTVAFVLAATGITVPTEGRIWAQVLTREDSTGARPNFGITLTVNGVVPASPPPEGAFSYIRSSGGHNEASNITAGLLDVQAGDEISFQHTRLSTNASAVTAPVGDIKLDLFYLSVS